MKQVMISQGAATVSDVPSPTVEPGTVLVQVDHSCISTGTELSGVKSSGEPIWKKALQQPGRIKQVADLARKQGIRATQRMVERKTDRMTPTGYSIAGTVVKIGLGIKDLYVGQRVACAGDQYAFHAQVVRVPRNLAVAVPDSVELAAASTVTLGAIALQGVRRAAPTLGETFVVIGLGVLGQLCVQLLRAHGCKVIGSDMDADRVALAGAQGMDMSLDTDEGKAGGAVQRLTQGVGADGVIITAATSSDEVISTAFKCCRRKGRVVLVGDVGLNIQRTDIYAKELDLLVSTSYGPGRYDPAYEEGGHDYPVGYVRWTENRNMEAYLSLLAEARVAISPLISQTFELSEAPAAFRSLESDPKPLMVLLSYSRVKPETGSIVCSQPRTITHKGKNQIGMGIAGAGDFVSNMHLPNLEKCRDLFHLTAIMGRSGQNAAETARQFGAIVATTDFEELLSTPSVHAILIGTRHDNHADLTLHALQAGKHVLVEKPLALSRKQLTPIIAFYERNADSDNPAPMLMTGFNRRFAPHIQRIKHFVDKRTDAMMLTYRMNAGYLPTDHWVHGPQGGGRNIGEACHIYDLFTYLTGSHVVDIWAHPIRPKGGHYRADDNFTATLRFDCGSVATLTYTALGSNRYPKEKLEVFTDGQVLEMDDYKNLSIHASTPKTNNLRTADKGHLHELRAFGEAVKGIGDWPIPLWQQIQATEIAFNVEKQITHD